ncbi:MAG: Fe-S cluster assembly protein SufB [Candidatus Roizmanbacteria bacterium]
MPDTPNFDYRFGFSMPDKSVYKAKKGLNADLVRTISRMKKEPQWMTDFRLESFQVFEKKSVPTFGPGLDKLNFDNLYYYLKPTDHQVDRWQDLPPEIKETYDRIGVPEAEKKYLSGVSAQYDSEVVYESVQKKLIKDGVLFCDMSTAVSQYPEIVKRYFGKLIPAADNKFAALNSAVWSGGSFVYVPPGVKVDLPLQAYFRINSERFGQFERTLIIVEPGGEVNYIEGCTAPVYATDSLHAAVVEIFVGEGAHCRYTTVQNWSKNVFNLVTKRARAEKNAHMEWIDCNLGSQMTMKYPSVYLAGEGAKGETLSIALASAGQVQDVGAKMIHMAPRTTSRIISKSICKDGGRTSYRGLISILPCAIGSKVYVSCDAMLIDGLSRSDTYPKMDVKCDDVEVQHEATVERLSEEKLLYLMSRGISKIDAEGLIVNGFIAPITREIPLEYSIELNKLINLEMKGSIG